MVRLSSGTHIGLYPTVWRQLFTKDYDHEQEKDNGVGTCLISGTEEAKRYNYLKKAVPTEEHLRLPTGKAYRPIRLDYNLLTFLRTEPEMLW